MMDQRKTSHPKAEALCPGEADNTSHISIVVADMQQEHHTTYLSCEEQPNPADCEELRCYSKLI